MRPYISLLIDGQEVEFAEPPQIFMSYEHYDLHNPTVVKNSFSKTVKVEGTPNNNRIFGCFGDVTRITAYGDGSYNGAYFNASRKVEFTLMRNSEIVEMGYVKLDKIIKNNLRIDYQLTLYGGLGQFLYNLQYKEDGEQMKLSDLEYDISFNFDVTKETVYAAWQHLCRPNPNVIFSPYDIINFAPCYNGIPENFSADKVAIDIDTMPMNTRMELGIDLTKGNLLNNRWMLGELAKEYDEWQAKDLRSYLQRPVIRFKEIIKACCNPENNGGYTVDLDGDFFSENNPYYEDAWMTLPLLSEMESIEGDGAEYAYLQMNGDKITIADIADGTALKTIRIPMTMCANASAGGASKLYTGVQITLNPSSNHWVESYNACRYVQLVVYDGNGNVVGGSNINSFYTNIKNAVDFAYNPTFNSTINKINGDYIKAPDSNLYVFNASLYDLVIQNIEWKTDYYMKLVVKSAEIRNYEDLGENVGINCLYKRNEYHKSEETVSNVSFSGVIDGNMFEIVSITDNSKKIRKNKILNSEHTPCDYFLSYLKMFNLHIWKDVYDKKIFVRKRGNYFTGEKIDLNTFLDRGDEMTITPITFENKWLVFNTEYDSDEKYHKNYIDNYGLDYGIQKVDTNYNFDSSSKELFENNVFKGCITARGRSKYYVDIYNKTGDYRSLPPYVMDGVQTYLFNDEMDTVENAYITPKNSAVSINWWKTKYYDIFPKPNFTDKENKGIEGANVLLFFNGVADMYDANNKWAGFYITDDIPEFEQLNEGEPCWIYVGGNNGGTISIDVGALPMFGRYKTNKNKWVTHSWDFGTPKEIFIPDYSVDQSSSLYTQFWKPYINDMYNIDTKILECKVLLKEKVVGEWLQRFYYFDGCYWILNKIIDYNITFNGTTKCEFIKVNDLSNYLE